MLDLPRHLLADSPDSPPRITIVGVGNAGVSLIDRLTLAGLGGALDLVAVNTDSVSLGSSVASSKILIGSRTARGLGTGGDPEVGASAAEEAEAELGAATEEAGVVVICAGLGGGVGGGAGPVIAEAAKRTGKFVIVLATLPFPFEGRRRVQQADQARQEFARACDAMLIFENDRMAELAEPLAGVHETFAASDQLLTEAVGFLARLALSAGPIQVTLSDLIAIFGRGADRSAFGFAQASGSNRANEAVEKALKCPLMGRGRPLGDAANTLVHITGPASLSLAEVRAVMDALARLTDGQLHLGVAIDPEMRDALAVSILAPIGATAAVSTPRPTVAARPQPRPAPTAPVPEIEMLEPEEPVPANASELFDTEPYRIEKKSSSRKPPKTEQKTLSLDPVARGRFEKSEPTIVGGEDLDVPTFLRQKVKLR